MTAAGSAGIALACPLAGTIVIGLLYKQLKGRSAGWIGTGALALSFVFALITLAKLQSLDPDQRHVTGRLWEYVGSAGVHADLGVFVDPLSVMMLLIVTGVSTLIHLYSVSYMNKDVGYSRYFAYLNFFVFSMLLLVLAGNFVLLIVGWAFVGAASYLLISFWYRRETATAAGIKAFVMNVIGDIALVIAAFLLLRDTGHLDYAGAFEGAVNHYASNDATIVWICVFILIGAFAKSAQLPLHTWLPDAMEGPTPVSSLIHAATMVTAGVYLIARCHPLFEIAPTAADIGAIIGTATLFVAATIALVQTDLKKVIAYSTMSQMGYMILGVSSFAYYAGMTHLMTHAFFKALLFMGAGSVIGAMAGEQSLDKMGGFRKSMPFTFITFTTGALALAAFPLFSGFFSKDAILAYDVNKGGLDAVLAGVGYVAALMTAFYSFRLVFRVFYGDPVPEARELEEGHLAHGEHRNPANGEIEDTDVGFPGPEHFVAEREWPMKIAMAPLAVLSVIAGIVILPGITKTIETFLEPTFADSKYAGNTPSPGTEWGLLILGGAISLLGIGIAYVLYMRRRGETAKLIDRFHGLHDFLANKWYFDELYDMVFVRPVRGFGNFGRTVIESAFVQGTIIGGAVGIVRVGSSFARSIQSGYIRAYAGLLLIGLFGLALYFLIVSS